MNQQARANQEDERHRDLRRGAAPGERSKLQEAGEDRSVRVGMRLGCLNHALLTRRKIEACGLRCAGWVANCLFPDMPHLDGNIRALGQRLDCPLIGVLPFRRDLDAAQAASLLSLGPLLEAIL